MSPSVVSAWKFGASSPSLSAIFLELMFNVSSRWRGQGPVLLAKPAFHVNDLFSLLANLLDNKCISLLGISQVQKRKVVNALMANSLWRRENK